MNSKKKQSRREQTKSVVRRSSGDRGKPIYLENKLFIVEVSV